MSAPFALQAQSATPLFFVASRTALKAVNTNVVTRAFLREAGREGMFVWRTGDYSAEVTADTEEGVYVKADAVASTSGAWVREDADVAFWNASWFGAVADDSTDNATALAGAISAFPTTGGVLFLGAGIYRLSTLTIDKPVVVEGLGSQSGTTIKATATTGDVITITADGAAIRAVRFDATGNRTTGAYIVVDGVSRSHFDLLYFTKYFFGIDFDGATSCSIGRSDFRDGTPNATAAGGAGVRFAGTSSTDNRLDTVTMDAAAGSQPTYGILLSNCDATQIVNCDIIHHGNCLHLAPGNGQSVAATYAANSYFDNASNGVTIAASGTGTVVRATFTACWASSHSNNGFNLTSAGGGVSLVQVIGCHAVLNTSRGMLIDIDCDLKVVGGYFNNNTVDGIAAGSGRTGFSIIGAQCRNNTSRGILLASANQDNFQIVGCDLRDNTVEAMSSTLANTSTKIIHSNLGVREVAVAKQIVTVEGSPKALTNNIATAQAIFESTEDAITVIASTTYRFRALIKLNTGATSHTTAFGFGGTATFTSISYNSQAISSAANALATPQMRRVEVATAAVLTAASVAVTTDIAIEGIFRINGGGTIIPQITFSAGPTGTCEVDTDSFFEIEPIGNNTVVAVANAA